MNYIVQGIILCIFSIGGMCSADVVINIDKGVRKAIPIAISANSLQPGIDDYVREVIENDLRSTSLFSPINSRAFFEKLNNTDQSPKFRLWQQINAQYLTNISVMNDGKRVFVKTVLYDVLSQKSIGDVTISGDVSRLRRIAHLIANSIYERIIGATGYFDTQIVYVANYRVRGRKLYRLSIMDQDGHNQKYLSGGNYIVLTPRFAPNGREFAYFCMTEKIVNGRRVPLHGSVYIYNLLTGQNRLVKRFEGMSYAPRFSPDGTKLIFSLSHRGSSSIYTYNLVTGETKKITKGPYIDTSPCYSPDGKYVVFNSDRAGSQRLYIMDSDGNNIHPLSLGRGRYATPVWSPRGDWIAFAKFGTGQGFFIGICHPDGSSARMLAKGDVLEGPTWAPNGMALWYSHQAYSGRCRIYGIDIAGYNKHELKTTTDAIDPECSRAATDDDLKSGKIVIYKNM